MGGEGGWGAGVFYGGWGGSEVFPGGADVVRVTGCDERKEGFFLCARALLLKHFGRTLKSCSHSRRSGFVGFIVGGYRVSSLIPGPFCR